MNSNGRQIACKTNQQVSLYFSKSNKYELYQTYSLLDLFDLDKCQKAKDITFIEPETIIAIFEGHSIFSIFYEEETIPVVFE